VQGKLVLKIFFFLDMAGNFYFLLWNFGYHYSSYLLVGGFDVGGFLLSLVVVIFVLTLLPVIVGLIRGIFYIQLFKGLNLLNGRVLNKIRTFILLSMWWGDGLKGTRKRVIHITLRGGPY